VLFGFVEIKQNNAGVECRHDMRASVQLPSLSGRFLEQTVRQTDGQDA